MTDETKYIDGPNGYKLAYNYVEGTHDAGLVFLPGLKSDKNGSKAQYLSDLAKEKGFSYLRLDYGGHGESGGKFTDGCMSEWYEDAKHIIQSVTKRPQVVVGSSMGGWVGLLLAHHHNIDMKGFIGIAPAPDFTQDFLDHALTEAQKCDLEDKGFCEQPSDYGEPYIFTRKLFVDGEANFLLNKEIDYDGPVHILQGKQDASVDWRKPERIKAALKSEQVEITLIEDGDHSLSRPQDLEKLKAASLKLLGL
jgi:pimeloyl-ACP methyl ester carboxylesterase